MPRRRIGQEELLAAGDRRSALDDLMALIDWSEVAARLEVVHAAAMGEASWPPLAMFRALLLSFRYDLSDVKLAEALDDRASFRRFCGFSRGEATPERTAFVRFRRAPVAHGLGTALFETITAQLEARPCGACRTTTLRRSSPPAPARSSASAAGSRRSPEPGSAATASGACDGAKSRRPTSSSPSPPPPAISAEPPTSSEPDEAGAAVVIPQHPSCPSLSEIS